MSAADGEVYGALAAELAERTREGLIVWLDPAGDYTVFVDHLLAEAGDDRSYRLRAFRGSYLELLLALDGLAGGVDPTPLVIHLPGVDSNSVINTPVYELYKASVSPTRPPFELPLVEVINRAASGRVRPEAIAAFIGEHGSPTLELADAWLTQQVRGHDERGAGPLGMMKPTEAIDDLLAEQDERRIQIPRDQQAVWQRLGAWTGLSDQWRDRMLPASAPLRAEEVAFVATSWALCVEYVNDYRGTPSSGLQALAELPSGVIETCKAIAVHLRERKPDYYRRTADATEAMFGDEVEAARAEDLGQIDTFRFEDAKLLEAALVALERRRWDQAADWAARRIDERSVWLRDDPYRHATWQLVLDAAGLGQAIRGAAQGLDLTAGLAAAIQAYTQRGAAVDRAHRHLEQRRRALLDPQLPEFVAVRARLDDMRGAWREWADAWARDFNTICQVAGFLPRPSLQQRTIFDDVVRPLAQRGGTVFFMIDALRFEMAQELLDALAETPGTQARLEARLAELPTVTEVGMNVLAPVAVRGRLTPAIAGRSVLGFSTGEFRVRDRKTRLRAIYARAGGRPHAGLSLEQVVSKDHKSLARAVRAHGLLVVHSREIDEAGDSGQGLGVFAQIIQKIRAAWRLLRDAGATRFVFAADHGFLLLDDSPIFVQRYGRKVDPKCRYTLAPAAEVQYPNEVRVALANLDYEGAEGHVVFPASTAIFDTGQRSMTFAHGGNSLQERVIPVLTVEHVALAGGVLLQYAIQARPAPGFRGMHCVEVEVEVVGEAALDFFELNEIELALRVTEVPDVHVELCSVRDGGRIERGAVQAPIGAPFKLYFRLSGRVDARVQIELHHPAAAVDIAPFVVGQRFDVTVDRRPPSPAATKPKPATTGKALVHAQGWLEQLPAGVRKLFEHLATHGTVTATEAVKLLGSERALRRFSLAFDDYLAIVPFSVRIDSVSGVKRYIKEDGES